MENAIQANVYRLVLGYARYYYVLLFENKMYFKRTGSYKPF